MSTNDDCQTSVVLIGLRGSGKSTVAKLLADRSGKSWIDTDDEIVRQSGQTIREIFEQKGEACFRQLEKKVIGDACSKPHGVISVGGGAVLDEGNVEQLRAVGTTVWLTALPEILVYRMNADEATKDQRPALTNADPLEEMELLESERRHLYANAADFTIDTTGRAPEEIVNEILSLLPDTTS